MHIPTIKPFLFSIALALPTLAMPVLPMTGMPNPVSVTPLPAATALTAFSPPMAMTCPVTVPTIPVAMAAAMARNAASTLLTLVGNAPAAHPAPNLLAQTATLAQQFVTALETNPGAAATLAPKLVNIIMQYAKLYQSPMYMQWTMDVKGMDPGTAADKGMMMSAAVTTNLAVTTAQMACTLANSPMMIMNPAAANTMTTVPIQMPATRFPSTKGYGQRGRYLGKRQFNPAAQTQDPVLLALQMFQAANPNFQDTLAMNLANSRAMFMAQAKQNMNQVATTMAPLLATTVAMVVNDVVGIGNIIGNGVSGAANTVANGAVGAANNLANGLVGGANIAQMNLVGAANTLAGTVIGVTNQVGNAVVGAGLVADQAAMNAINQAAAQIVASFAMAQNGVVGAGNTVANGVVNAANTVENVAVNVANEVANTATNVVNDIGNFFAGLF